MPAAPARRNILGRCVGFVHGASEVVAVACFFGLFVLIIVQVHYRYVLNNPLSWPEEVARNLFIWTVYLGLVKNFREDSHYRIDFLVNRLGRRVRHAILLGVDIASGVLFVAVLSHAHVVLAVNSHIRTSIDLPVNLIYASLPFAILLILPVLIASMARHVGELMRPGRLADGG